MNKSVDSGLLLRILDMDLGSARQLTELIVAQVAQQLQEAYEYMTELPPREVLQRQIQKSLEAAKARLGEA